MDTGELVMGAIGALTTATSLLLPDVVVAVPKRGRAAMLYALTILVPRASADHRLGRSRPFA